MDPSTDWQTPTALAVVAFTVLAFVLRAIKARRRPRPCSGCGTAPKPTHRPPHL
jgi:hypothetical protein